MGEINLMNLYPRSNRPIDQRKGIVTAEHRRVARQFGKSFFDGDRLYGYGGYNYHSRFWSDTVTQFYDHYELTPQSKILDVGCAKGFMLYDFKKLEPKLHVSGIDISEYAIENSVAAIKSFLKVGSAEKLPYNDNTFDLVISINTIHNLDLSDCKKAIHEIKRVSKAHSFITVDAWRSDEEKERMLAWNLTAKTYMHTDEWKDLFLDVGYEGDFYWFIP